MRFAGDQFVSLVVALFRWASPGYVGRMTRLQILIQRGLLSGLPVRVPVSAPVPVRAGCVGILHEFGHGRGRGAALPFVAKDAVGRAMSGAP